MLKRDDIFNYVEKKYDVKPYYAWEKYPSYAVLRHDNDKWFGLIMNVQKEKLGIDGNDSVDVLDLKAPPDIIGSLRLSKDFLPAYHMNKEHWVSILLDGSVPTAQICELIDSSFDLTKMK
ncbi:MmcQ/YjbR family DNA-binding protein [Entomomonas moraniae]|uniref:MmcQ/YjbR family DNA-binding protein n=1 Tax=Entomomonas moraniae TaxID=2213226 RepID=A0A3Q9JHC1_9GAMM|nr:MmcQ/YjbR family DNA-binding protein [Entomomonas moraniae]AZS49455.1 MmcQ/YjbR family DNA-binding protein [Entomomonas moraniae]